MTNFKKIIPVCVCFFFLFAALFAQDKNIETLSDIANSIDNYMNKNVTMTLKLRNIDRVFFTIVFYDDNNHDVSFDISDSKIWKRFEKQLLNAHEGMNYKVGFIVKGRGNPGILSAELVSFEPLILEIIP
ncbi:MAG: hypothetical protein FWG92_07090 [Leptospirales bacterium]|nr:hypothetical protein [Leptospirales bacterium]